MLKHSKTTVCLLLVSLMFKVLTLEELSWQHQLYQMADRQALNLNKYRYFTHCCCKIGRDAHRAKLQEKKTLLPFNLSIDQKLRFSN
jgi:hypothetical protein